MRKALQCEARCKLREIFFDSDFRSRLELRARDVTLVSIRASGWVDRRINGRDNDGDYGDDRSILSNACNRLYSEHLFLSYINLSSDSAIIDVALSNLINYCQALLSFIDMQKCDPWAAAFLEIEEAISLVDVMTRLHAVSFRLARSFAGNRLKSPLGESTLLCRSRKRNERFPRVPIRLLRVRQSESRLCHSLMRSRFEIRVASGLINASDEPSWVASSH